jgi:hypothetical protein
MMDVNWADAAPSDTERPAPLRRDAEQAEEAQSAGDREST